ncbi:MAG: hypothetical protein JWN70_3669 [Planctomycetaceae bacterium]|nr:hypothetical protein [Planctomycetaceae bacterium]
MNLGEPDGVSPGILDVGWASSLSFVTSSDNPEVHLSYDRHVDRHTLGSLPCRCAIDRLEAYPTESGS